VNCSVVPNATEGLGGVTAMETRVGVVTVSAVEPLTLPDAAVVVVVPWVTVVARPELETVAIAVADEVQVAELVRFWVLPSV
jgi:hypothetical protein